MHEQDASQVAAHTGLCELGRIRGYGGQLLGTQQTGLRRMGSTAVTGEMAADQPLLRPQDQIGRDSARQVYRIAFRQDLAHEQAWAFMQGLVAIRVWRWALLERTGVVLVDSPVGWPTTVPTPASATAGMRVGALSGSSGRARHLVREVSGMLVQLDNSPHVRLQPMAIRSTDQAVARLDGAATRILLSLVHLNVREVATAAAFVLSGPAERPGLSFGGSRPFPPVRELPSQGLVVGRAIYLALERDIATMPSDTLRHLPVAGLAVSWQGAERGSEVEGAMVEQFGRVELGPQRTRRTSG